MTMRIFAMSLLLAVSLSGPAWSQATAPAVSTSARASTVLPAVTVTGEQPGPGLWKVSKSDHVMWVLGTLTPLPRGMEWRSKEVEDTLAHSQELLEAPKAEVKVDVGFFGKLFLMPSVYSARKNPGGATLEQILPTQMYARWQEVKPQYFGNDRRIESWRPILVAMELYKKALDKAGLTSRNDINKLVFNLADKHGVKRVPVKYKLTVEHPRATLDAIKQTNLHDISCFNQTLNIVQNDMPSLTERANAWSTGDIQALRSYAVDDRYQSCVIAVLNAEFAEELGLRDLPKRMQQSWLQAAEAALARNTQTFAVLPMEEVLAPDGYLAQLQAQGYTVEAPE
jgi:uncharacterized protein YbaP (TraB family)